MLNPIFSKEVQEKILACYVAPIEITNCTPLGDEVFETGDVEYRSQSVFGGEVFLRLEYAVMVQLYGMNLSGNKPSLSNHEVGDFNWAISFDRVVNRVLPQRYLDTIYLVYQR